MRFSLSRNALLLAGAVLLAAPAAYATTIPIPGLYSTGVDDDGNALGECARGAGQVDLQHRLDRSRAFRGRTEARGSRRRFRVSGS